ncbi:MAG: hypothetical protein ACLQL2_11760 [Methylovirgula sp.]
MISDQALDQAVARNILTAAQAEELRALARAEAPAYPPPLPPPPPLPASDSYAVDDEKLRFVAGFADIFVTMGLGFFFGAAYYLLSLYVAKPEVWALTAIFAWLLAEFFTRQHRMALPSIVLLAIFATAVFRAVIDLSPAVVSEPMFAPFDMGAAPRDWPLYWLGGSAPVVIEAGLATALATSVYYWRFRVPITIAAGVGALVAASLAGILVLFPNLDAHVFDAIALVLGLGVFALAMHFDLSDPARQTRRADIAFWLHLLAAPLIVQSLIGALRHSRAIDTTFAFTILGVFVVLGIVSLVIDRRALLASGLAYAGGAFGVLIGQTALADKAGAITILLLGLFVLLLSAGWRPLRGELLNILPESFVQNLPHPRSQIS